MISFLRGTVVSAGAYTLLLEVSGVGYELFMSTKALAGLPAKGEECVVQTYMHIKDDSITMFGFKDALEKSLFSSLIGVSGIGPKLAIAALSTYTPQQTAAFIAEGDVAAISRVPGIGKKTAQRIVLELKGVLKDEQGEESVSLGDPSVLADARAALMAMGFSDAEVSASLKDVDASSLTSSELVRAALKRAGGR